MRTSCPRWKLRTTFTARGGRGAAGTSVVVVPAVPVALDRWQERRLEVRDGAGRGLAVDELGFASLAGGAEAAFAAPQADGDDVAVLVAMLDGGVLGHVHGPHPRVASAVAPGLSIDGRVAAHRCSAPGTLPRCRRGTREPSRPRDQPIPPAACSQPRRLVSLG